MKSVEIYHMCILARGFLRAKSSHANVLLLLSLQIFVQVGVYGQTYIGKQYAKSHLLG